MNELSGIISVIFAVMNTVYIFLDVLIVIVFQEHAFESSQKYKEGKYIIELAHMIKDNGWD